MGLFDAVVAAKVAKSRRGKARKRGSAVGAVLFNVFALLLIIGLLVGIGAYVNTRAPVLAGSGALTLTKVGSYETKVFDEAAAEVVAFLPERTRAYVTNASANAVEILDLAKPQLPRKIAEISLSPFGKIVNSVAVRGDLVVAAVEASDRQSPGQIAFFNSDGRPLGSAPVGAVPDMVTITPDGRYALVANEGEPNADYSVDPPGSVTIVELGAPVNDVIQASLRTVTFDGVSAADLTEGLRLAKPDVSPALDFEPEYIAVSPDSKLAFVSLQENNGIAVIDIPQAKLLSVYGLGLKDWSKVPFDASDKDGLVHIARHPVKGMYQPDAIAVFEHEDELYLVLANEGDARDYEGYSEEARVADLTLDAAAFPDAEKLRKNAVIGRLKVTTANGDTDGDGEFEELHAFGGRSISIRKAMTGELVWDSGAELEIHTAARYPDDFNSDNAEGRSFDGRSDDKGPEPEAIAVGEIGERRYAFVGLERIGGIVVYEITDPKKPRLVTYVNPRKFGGDPKAGTAGDLGPETIAFVPGNASPTDETLILVANEVSGSTVVFTVLPRN